MEDKNTEEKNKMMTYSINPKEVRLFADLNARSGVATAQLLRGYMRLGLQHAGTDNTTLMKVIRLGSLE